MDRRDVIMPTKEDLQLMAEKGHRQQKLRGWIEMGLGLIVIAVGSAFLYQRMVAPPDYNESELSKFFTNKVFIWTVSGLVLFLVGLTRQFQEKKHPY